MVTIAIIMATKHNNSNKKNTDITDDTCGKEAIIPVILTVMKRIRPLMITHMLIKKNFSKRSNHDTDNYRRLTHRNNILAIVAVVVVVLLLLLLMLLLLLLLLPLPLTIVITTLIFMLITTTTMTIIAVLVVITNNKNNHHHHRNNQTNHRN